jgi:autotransporter-associated beta strand protein
VNVTGGTLTIGTSSAGVALGRTAAVARGFLNITGGAFILTSSSNVLRVGAGFSDLETTQTGASVLSISGTGLLETGVTLGTILLGSNLAGNSASTGTLNLDGGTLATLRSIISGSVGAGIVNFNGGILKANGASLTVNLGTLGTTNVRNGGAVIDTNGFDITIAQALRHSTIAGDNAMDGGLTKKGAGILTLSGANAFTGAVALNAGTLNLSGANTLAGPVAINAGALIVAGGSTLGGGVTLHAGTVTVNGTNSFAGNVTVNAGAMTINGENTFSGDMILNTGALTVNGQNAVTGSIEVNAGKLLVSGSIAGATGAAGVNIASGATLATTGANTTIKTAANGNIEIGGNLSPGDFGIARTLTLDPGAGGKLNFLSGSTFKFDIGFTTASSDRVIFSSAGDWLGGSGNVTLALNESGFEIDYGETYIIFQNVSTAGFQFADITGYDDELFSAGVTQSGNDYVLRFSEAVPEPGSMGSLLGGLSLLLGLHRFRRRAGGWSQNRMHKPPLAHAASSIVHLH